VAVEPTDVAVVTLLPSMAMVLLLSLWSSSPPLSISIHTPFHLFSVSVWNSAIVASASTGAKEQSHQCVIVEEIFSQPRMWELAEWRMSTAFVDTFYNLVTDIYEWGWAHALRRHIKYSVKYNCTTY
jgi:hypothetical protein